MRHVRYRNGLAGIVLGVVAVASASAEVTILPQTRGYLEQALTPEQVRAAVRTLAQVEQDTLGPQPLTDAQRQHLVGPAQVAHFAPAQVARAHGLAGEGTEANPYRGVLAAFLAELAPQAVTVIVPPGHYEEFKLDVPEGVWLRSDVAHQAVIQSPAGEPGEYTGYLVSLVSHSALIGFTLDGSCTPFTWQDGQWRGQAMRLPDQRLSGVLLRRRAQERGPRERDIVVAGNVLREFSGAGIVGEQFRRRWGATEVLVIENRLENIGYAGITVNAGWTVCNNVVHYAGILRPDGGGGDDGIIVHWANRAEGSEGPTLVANNLVLASRQLTGYGRHGIANHTANEVTVRGNLVVVEGQVRGGLRFSDGCDGNQILGNVVLQWLIDEGQVTRDGIGISGWNNQIAGNAVFGTSYFLYLNRWRVSVGEAAVGNVVKHNGAWTPQGSDTIAVRGAELADLVLDAETVTDRNDWQIAPALAALPPLPKRPVPAFWFEAGRERVQETDSDE